MGIKVSCRGDGPGNGCRSPNLKKKKKTSENVPSQETKKNKGKIIINEKRSASRKTSLSNLEHLSNPRTKVRPVHGGMSGYRKLGESQGKFTEGWGSTNREKKKRKKKNKACRSRVKPPNSKTSNSATPTYRRHKA